MIRRPPSSPLFPYPPLFRSRRPPLVRRVFVQERRLELPLPRRVGREREPRCQLPPRVQRSEEHTSELQSPCNLVCRLLLEKKKTCPDCSCRCVHALLNAPVP